MEAIKNVKRLFWVGSSRKDIQTLPARMYSVLLCIRPRKAASIGRQRCSKGFQGGGVLEVVEDHHGDTYRAVYTVSLADAVYVLHCFQKKSRSGIKTSKHDVDLIHARLKLAQAHSKGKTHD